MTPGRALDRATPGVLLALLAGYAVVPLDVTGLRTWYHATTVLAMLAGFLGVYRHRPAHARGWLLVLSGFTGWAVGDAMGLAEQLAAPGDPPFPAPSDAAYLLAYVLLGAGVLTMVRTRRSGSDRAAFLDASIFTAGVTVVVAVFLIVPLATAPATGLAARLVSTAYPVGDLFLLAALARMLTSPGAHNRSYRLLVAAVLATGVGDIAWNIQVIHDGDTGSDSRLINLCWLAAYVLVAVATNSSTMALVAEPAPPAEAPPFGRRRVVAMAVGLLLPAVVLVVDGVTDVHVDWQLIAVASGVMSVLVLARFVDLLSVVQTQAVQLAALARTDALTGVPNRRSWDYELGRAYELAREHDAHLAVAVIDLDHFKAFNDGHGHQAGDLLLKEAATAWRDALPADAVLARYGGEEFAVLLPGHRLDEAAAAIGRLRGCTPGGQTFSAGVCEWRYAGRPANPLLLVTHADRALYRAKQSGRDRVAVAPPPGPDPVPAPRAAASEAEQRP